MIFCGFEAIFWARRRSCRRRFDSSTCLLAMARASALSKALVAAGAFMALRLLSGDAFVTPKQRNEAAAALAAAMVAASSAPAMAEVPQFSIFGFGSGQSDAYSQNDNPINPYSQFSEPGEDSVYKARSEAEVARRTKALQAALKRFENTPEYINTKQAQGLKANLLEAGGSLKEDMYYFSGAEGSKTYEKARQFAQKVGTLGVDGQNKQWARAAEDFTVASKILAEWKQMSNFQ